MDSVELQDTPFFAQTTYQCGPAALATLLVRAGRDVSPAELSARVYLPRRKGSLQVELVGAARREGLVPYRIDPELGALVEELHAGRPVLVLQNLGLNLFPVWHYAVAIGYQGDTGSIILRSGAKRRKLVRVDPFRASWERASSWGLVVLTPGELPARPDRLRFLEAAAGLEAVGRYQAALAAFRAALGRWPLDRAALLGVGNSLYGLGDLPAAERHYRRLVAHNPGDPVGLNNLAQVLSDQGRHEEAREAMARGLSSGQQDRNLRRILEDTEASIATRGSRRRRLQAPR